MAGHIPIKVHDIDAHTHHHAVLEDRVLTGKTPLIIGKEGRVIVSINENGQYVLDCSVKPTGGGSSSIGFTGEYSPVIIYKLKDIAIISLGLNQGTFVCVSSAPISGISPTTGSPNWVQLPGGLLGQWF